MPAPFFYNRKGIIDAVFDQHDWAPSQSESAQKKIGRFLDRAMNTMAEDSPYLFFEREIRLAVHPDRFPSDQDTLTTTADAWVLRTELPAGASAALDWESDREWGGRYLMVLLPKADPQDDDEWHSIRIREVWQDTVGVDPFIFISLERPWRNTTDTAMKYRVVSNEYVLPDNLIELHSASVIEDNTSFPYPLAVIGQTQAEFATFPNHSELQASGVPRVAYRREYQQKLRAPTRLSAQIDDPDTGDAWLGPEAIGEFEYIITYTWGKQEIWTHSPGPSEQDTLLPEIARYEPYWESAPSPVSNRVEVGFSPVVATQPGKAVVLNLPNVDFTMGFDEKTGGPTTVRYHRAGIKKRIWRRRLSSQASPFTPGSEADYPDGFFLLDVVDGHTISYTDNGTKTPDYNRMLREVHGYQTFRLYPRPNKRMELVLRATLSPAPLVNDTDVPAVKKGATEALVHLVSSMLFDAEGETAHAQREEQKYERTLHRLAKRYGDMRPANRLRRRRTARPQTRTWVRRDVAGVVKNA
jgi:hypothetical protein